MSAVSSNVASKVDAASITGRFIGEVFLGTIRIRPDLSEPPQLARLRYRLRPLARLIGGREKLLDAAEQLRPVFHTVADVLFDRVCRVDNPDNIEKLKTLPPLFLTWAEAFIQQMTGQVVEGERGKWDRDLYHWRGQIQNLVSQSITGLSFEQVRSAYDPVLHAIIDTILDNWPIIVNA